jgi:TFIIF-interacting CTD phosphatase-like protein
VAELVLYTSAAEGYASEIVKEIDPAGTRFLRVLTRQHCHPLQVGSYAKDLAGLGRPLERTVLVDDSNNSFMMQPDNGIPITAYFGNPTDRDLVRILHLLRHLHAEADDVRPFLRERFAVQQKLLARVQAMRHESTRLEERARHF